MPHDYFEWHSCCAYCSQSVLALQCCCCVCVRADSFKLWVCLCVCVWIIIPACTLHTQRANGGVVMVGDTVTPAVIALIENVNNTYISLFYFGPISSSHPIQLFDFVWNCWRDYFYDYYYLPHAECSKRCTHTFHIYTYNSKRGPNFGCASHKVLRKCSNICICIRLE